MEVQPKNAADKVDFKRAQIVLFKDTMLPRRLWFEQPNSTETTWDVLQINNNDKTIDRREFDAPTPPPGLENGQRRRRTPNRRRAWPGPAAATDAERHDRRGRAADSG